MIKIWGRNTSSNVQKAMWAVGELGLAHSASTSAAPWQEQGAEISGDESERPGADAGRRRRLPAVGDQFHRALSRRQIRQERQPGAEGCPSSARAPASGWIGNCRWWDRRSPSLLGPDPHAAGKARPRRDQDLAGEDHRRHADHGRAIGEDAISSPAMRFPTATSRSASCATATANWCPAVRRRPTSTAGTTPSPSRKAFQDHVGSIPLS